MAVSGSTDSLSRRTTRGGQWRLGGSLVGGFSQLLVGIPLARLLTPADFGIFGLSTVVVAFAQPLTDLGLANALVQRLRLTDRHVRAAFTLLTILGAAGAAALIVGAPLAARLTRTPDVAPVLRILAPAFAVRAAAAVAEGLLRRNLDFKRQVLIEVASYLLGYGCVALPLALTGHGVWSLAWGSVVQTVVASSAQLAVVRHAARPLLARQELGELIGFGLGASSSSWVNYLALNGDDFIVGRLLGARSLGLYGRAFGLMKLPHTYFSTVVSRVTFPAFAQVQHDRSRLQRGYLLITELTATVAAPALGTLAVVAPHFLRTVYGEQWEGAVVPLQILCIAGYFRALYHLGGVVAQSVGRVYAELRRQIVYAALVIAGAALGTPYQLAGVAAGVAIATLYMFVASGDLALRITGTSWRVYLGAQRGALVIAAVTSAAAFAVRLLLERLQVPSALITFSVLAAAGAVWSACALRTVAASPSLRELLPVWSLKWLPGR